MDERGRLLQRIIDDAKSGQLKLPPMPDIAVRLREALSDPNRNSEAIARIIQADPGASGRLIQVANSPLYGGSSKVTSCKTAVTRLGREATRNLVTSFIMRNMFESPDLGLMARFKATWQHSCKVAAISYVLARLNSGINPDSAMLAGLTHDIGILPLLRYAADTAELINNPALLDQIISQTSPALGSMILKSWKFDDELAQIPRLINDWQRDSGPVIDHCDIVQVAHIHSFFGTEHALEHPSLAQLPAFNKMPISEFGPDASIELLEESQDEIATLIQLLQG